MKGFFKDVSNRMLIIASVALNVGLFIFLYLFTKQSDIPIVLHYNVDWGVDYLGEVKTILILPAIGAIIFFINEFLALNFWDKNRFLSYFLSVMTLLAQCFIILAGIALYMINR